MCMHTFSSMLGCLLACLAGVVAVASSLDWKLDPEFESITDGTCDFQVFDAADIQSLSLDIDQPYIVRGLVTNWPAIKNWKKDRFLQLYGQNVIRSGSESSIVHSGGVAENETSLTDMIDAMGIKGDQVYGDSFLFDTTVLKAIPSLKDDFNVPDIFQEWDNEATEGRTELWHMLSLGPTQSGLPFHNHGKTWLAVVHGIKQWFLYPPGYDPPRVIDEAFNPMFPVSTWLTDVYAQIKSYPKPPMPIANSTAGTARIDANNAKIASTGYRPLECRQQSGDVLFLPSRWTHLTVNIGETIAIGGQETLFDQDRLDRARNVLEVSSHNYDAWKDLGLAQFNMASTKLREVRGLIKEQVPDGPLVLRDVKSLDDLLEKTRDTWAVLYYDSTAAAGNVTLQAAFGKIQKQWALLAQRARENFNVAAVDIGGKYSVRPLAEELRESDLKAVRANRSLLRFHEVTDGSFYRVDDLHSFIALPTMKLHRGDVSEVVQPDNYAPDTEGLDYDGDLSSAEAIYELVMREMEIEGLALGSVESVPVYLRRCFGDALHNMQRARQIKPLQPELLCMIGEVAGLAHDFDSMHDALLGAGRMLDAINRRDMAALSLASIYHKLAHVYIKLSLSEHALPLLQRSLQALPTFLPSMIDYVYVHVVLDDRDAAEFALEQLKLAKRDFESTEDYRRLAGQIAQTPWR